MAKENSFDIVSRVDLQEVDNAVNQALKEVQTRFDFKGSVSRIERQDHELILLSDDEFRLGALLDILQGKLVKRGVSLKALRYGKVEPAAGGAVRQRIAIQQGIDTDTAKHIVKLIKDSKIKVQASIQGDQVRVSGKSRDDLQKVIQLIKVADLSLEVQFTNFR